MNRRGREARRIETNGGARRVRTYHGLARRGRHDRLGVEREPQIAVTGGAGRRARRGLARLRRHRRARGDAGRRPASASGLSGEPSRDLNWIVAYGPDGVADGVSRAVRRLRERDLPGVVYAASPATGEVAGVAGELDLKPAGSLPVMCVHGGDVVRAEAGHEVRRVIGRRGSALRRRRARRRLRPARRLVPAAARRRLSRELRRRPLPQLP